jgi:F1F0 ATPase subunit 2
LTGLVAGFIGGVLLGALFFGGLWLTARRLVESPRPGLLLLGSYLLRLALVGVGFYGVLRTWGTPAVFAALLGLLVTRVLLVRRLAGDPSGDAAPTNPSTG